MASSTSGRAASQFGIIAAGAATGAAVAYYLASRPAVRRVIWQAVKLTLTTNLPAILLSELPPQDGDGVPSSAPGSALRD